jgi:hypothetical protein
MLVAREDRITPPVHAYRLAKAFAHKELTIEEIAGKGHNTISNDQRYYPLLKAFID